MTSQHVLPTFPIVCPSLLAADFGHLAREIRAAEEAGVEVFHLDIMDGHFVPNLSFGIPVVEAIRRATDRVLDVHLMLSEPSRYIEAFRRAGADWLTVHIEAVPQPQQILKTIRVLGARPGLSLNPPTDVHALIPFVGECDVVLVMSVMPGFGGQAFDRVALQKLATIRSVAHPTLAISVDGGISPATIAECAAAGANTFVVGSAFFGPRNYLTRYNELRTLAELR
ncbi:MAG: ribulose-phosphate 3-epimerase [Thermoguttaceae bacterium]